MRGKIARRSCIVGRSIDVTGSGCPRLHTVSMQNIVDHDQDELDQERRKWSLIWINDESKCDKY